MLVGYVDDNAAIITEQDFKLATEKTELLLLTKKHIAIIVDMRTATKTLRTQDVVSYLDVRLYSRLSQIQIQHATASKTACQP